MTVSKHWKKSYVTVCRSSKTLSQFHPQTEQEPARRSDIFCYCLFSRTCRPSLSQGLTSLLLSPLLWGECTCRQQGGERKESHNVWVYACVCLCVGVGSTEGNEIGRSVSEPGKDPLRNLQILSNGDLMCSTCIMTTCIMISHNSLHVNLEG